jgi:hypothetical protein
MTMQAASSEQRLQNVVHVLGSRLGVHALARLAVSSKAFHKSCTRIVRQDAASIMVKHLETAAAAQQVDEQQLAAVTWLLRQAPAAATAAGVSDGLAMLAGVPLDWAEQQVAAGVRIALAQLLTAANRMVLELRCGCRHSSMCSMASHPPLWRYAAVNSG